MSEGHPAPADPAAEIAAIRTQIDAIDSAILELVAQRGRCAGALAALKGPQAGSPLRLAREVQLVRRLVEQGGPKGLEPDLVVEVWRCLIGASVRRQGGVEVVAAGSSDGQRHFDAVRRHFGAGARIARLDDPRAALNRALEGPHVVAALPFPAGAGAGSWWPILNESRYHALFVLGAAPMRADGAEPEVALVGQGAPLEPAGGDQTLLVAFDPHYRLTRALNEAGLTGKEWGRARDVALIRIDGFLAPQDPRTVTMAKAGLDGVRVVGSFARI